jgi:hypothetical protein
MTNGVGHAAMLSDSETMRLVQMILEMEIDTTAPTGSVMINWGELYTTSTSVSLNPFAEDAGSGVFQMRFSDDGRNWSDWEAYCT